MSELQINNTIHFYDWEGHERLGTVKDILTLSDDFGDFYLVSLETAEGAGHFEVEDFNGVLVGELWAENSK